MANPAAIVADPATAPVQPPAGGEPEALPAGQPLAAPTAEDPVAKGLEVIADRERVLRKREDKVRLSEEERQELSTLRSLRSKIREDPDAMAKLLGYEDPKEVIRELALQLKPQRGPKSAEEQLAELRARLDAKEKAEKETEERRAKENEESRVQAAFAQLVEDSGTFVAANDAKYPEVASLDNPGAAIAQQIRNHWIKTWDSEAQEGERLTPERAAATLEAYLEARQKRAAEIRAKHKTPEVPPQKEAPPPPPEAKAVVQKSGEESGPREVKPESSPTAIDWESLDWESADLSNVDPDSVPDEFRSRFVATRLKRRFASQR